MDLRFLTIPNPNAFYLNVYLDAVKLPRNCKDLLKVCLKSTVLCIFLLSNTINNFATSQTSFRLDESADCSNPNQDTSRKLSISRNISTSYDLIKQIQSLQNLETRILNNVSCIY